MGGVLLRKIYQSMVGRYMDTFKNDGYIKINIPVAAMQMLWIMVDGSMDLSPLNVR